jgi:hypothetical protein
LKDEVHNMQHLAEIESLQRFCSRRQVEGDIWEDYGKLSQKVLEYLPKTMPQRSRQIHTKYMPILNQGLVQVLFEAMHSQERHIDELERRIAEMNKEEFSGLKERQALLFGENKEEQALEPLER